MLKTEVAKLLLDKYGKKNPPAVKSGDTIRVHQKIQEGEKSRVQIFEGLVIAVKHGRGLDGTFTVRKIGAGSIGVERTYPLHSPNIVKVERVKTAGVSRAKLYYMRDRKGKNARFKNETQNALTWAEPDAVIELPVEGTTAETLQEAIEAETPVEDAPIEAPEITPEEGAIDAPEVVPEESEAISAPSEEAPKA